MSASTEKRDAVSLRIEGSVAHVVIDWPPVNVLSASVRQGLLSCIAAAHANAVVEAIVLSCLGRTFVAGGDITEFGAPLPPPDVNEINALIENSAKPIVAALHGNVLGGGLEVAMACQGRVAAPQTRFGMPEVTLGLIPGAGGTIRLPRLVGLETALEMIGGGAPIPAEQALEHGLIDSVQDNPVAAATDMALRLVAYGQRPTRDLPVEPQNCSERDLIFEAARRNLTKRYPWSTSRAKAVDSVAFGLSHSFKQALAEERRIFNSCVESEEARSLMHVFFAERKIGNIPRLGKDAVLRNIDSVAVVGSGTMGRGIAIVFARAGISVVLVDADHDALQRASDYLDGHFTKEMEKGRLTADAAQAQRRLIVSSSNLQSVAHVDLILEAIYEERAVKRALFADIDRIAKAGAVLATNTSSLDVHDIASATSRPSDVIGLHFFSPAHVMPLLEIVRTDSTSEAVLRTAIALAARIRKTGVVVGNCFGFVANRMIFEYQRQAEFLVEEGTTPTDVDRVLKAFGMPMGPFEMFDMAGLDVGWRLRNDRTAERPKDRRYSVLNDLVCEAGWFGQKTGKGWYTYGASARDYGPNSDLPPLLETARQQAGIVPRAISDTEILDRCLLALVNEAAHILEQGYALRASDIDVTYIAGFGFPRHRGGPMHYADALGLGHVLDNIRQFATVDPSWWKPAPLLVHLVERGKNFADFDEGTVRKAP